MYAHGQIFFSAAGSLSPTLAWFWWNWKGTRTGEKGRDRLTSWSTIELFVWFLPWIVTPTCQTRYQDRPIAERHSTAGCCRCFPIVPSVPRKEPKPSFKCSSPAPATGPSSAPLCFFFFNLIKSVSFYTCQYSLCPSNLNFGRIYIKWCW